MALGITLIWLPLSIAGEGLLPVCESEVGAGSRAVLMQTQMRWGAAGSPKPAALPVLRPPAGLTRPALTPSLAQPWAAACL